MTRHHVKIAARRRRKRNERQKRGRRRQSSRAALSRAIAAFSGYVVQALRRRPSIFERIRKGEFGAVPPRKGERERTLDIGARKGAQKA